MTATRRGVKKVDVDETLERKRVFEEGAFVTGAEVVDGQCPSSQLGREAGDPCYSKTVALDGHYRIHDRGSALEKHLHGRKVGADLSVD